MRTAVDAEALESRGQLDRIVGAIAVQDDVAAGGDTLGREEALDLGLVDGAQPGGQERRRAGDVAAARISPETPPVVGGHRADVDDRDRRVVKPVAKSSGGDGRHGPESPSPPGRERLRS
jgi:hypothetical protein